MKIKILFLSGKFSKARKSQIASLVAAGCKEASLAYTDSIEAILASLLAKYKVENNWQRQLYELSDYELKEVVELGYVKILVPFSKEFYNSNFILFEDDFTFIFLLDSFIKMLGSRINKIDSLQSFYLFILENSGLPGVIAVPKPLYHSIYN